MLALFPLPLWWSEKSCGSVHLLFTYYEAALYSLLLAKCQKYQELHFVLSYLRLVGRSHCHNKPTTPNSWSISQIFIFAIRPARDTSAPVCNPLLLHHLYYLLWFSDVFPHIFGVLWSRRTGARLWAERKRWIIERRIRWMRRSAKSGLTGIVFPISLCACSPKNAFMRVAHHGRSKFYRSYRAYSENSAYAQERHELVQLCGAEYNLTTNT